MKQIIKFFIVIILIDLIFSLHFLSALPKNTNTHTLQILVTSDMHGWLSNQIIYPGRKPSGLLYIAEYIRQVRRKNTSAILVDAGDIISGSPLSIYYNHIFPTKLPEYPFFNLLNNLNYDAIIPGNHDLELYPLLENYYIPNSNAKWLAANIEHRAQPVFHPFLTIKQENFNIAIIGITTPGILMWSNFKGFKKTKIISVKKALKKWLQIIKYSTDPDFIILIIHGGLNPYRDDENTKLSRVPPANSIRSILPDLPEIDFVISGHDHRLSPYRSNQKLRYIHNRPVVSGGRHGEAVLNIKLKIQKNKKRWKITDSQLEVFKPSASIVNNSQQYTAFLKPDYLNFMLEPIPWRISKAKSSIVSKCINELMALSFLDQNTQGTLFPLIGKVPIRRIKGAELQRRHIYTWLRYPNKAVLKQFSRNDIHLLTHPHAEFGKRKIPYNRKLYPYFKTPSKNTFNKQNWWPDQKDFKKDIAIKISDYHYYGGGGVMPAILEKQNEEEVISGKIFQEQFIDYLKQNRQLKPDSCRFFQY